MRTTLNLPDGLAGEACALLGVNSKTDAVVLALRELVRCHRIEDLKSLLGKVKVDLDLPRSRRRP